MFTINVLNNSLDGQGGFGGEFEYTAEKVGIR